MKVFVLRHVFGQGAKINDAEAYGQANLRSGQSYAVALGQRLPHILNELRQVGIVRRDVFCHLAQHWLAIYIYR